MYNNLHTQVPGQTQLRPPGLTGSYSLDCQAGPGVDFIKHLHASISHYIINIHQFRNELNRDHLCLSDIFSTDTDRLASLVSFQHNWSIVLYLYLSHSGGGGGGGGAT